MIIKNLPNSPVSRLAPTPSGYLHIGNAYNFLITWWLVRHLKGKLVLRIDDADTTRCREEYIQDIFDSLKWLGLDWDLGPKDLEDFKQNYSQTLRKDHYFSMVQKCQNIFSCDCSRKIVKERSNDGTYPGICRNKNKEFVAGECALRIEGEEDDFIVWRKDDIPAYHLTSVVDDNDFGVNLIVRGEDLVESSEQQTFLAKEIGLDVMSNACIYHHKLILNEESEKLSKSNLSSKCDYHLVTMIEKKQSPSVLLKSFAKFIGINEAEIEKVEDLLKHRPPMI